MAFGSSDLSAIFADDLAVAVVYGVQETRGHFDSGQVQQIIDDVVMQVSQKSVRVATASLTGLQQDASIVVDGVTYKIRNWQPEDDGQTTQIILA